MNKFNCTITRLPKALPFGLLLITLACSSPSGRDSRKSGGENIDFPKGTYGYDVAFLAKHKVETIELKDEATGSAILVAPGYQGRVMTSSGSGPQGQSFGWINYDLISSGEVKPQFNPVGGEERLWLGPEGGPFSIYFAKGKEQVYENWEVPPFLDTESFDIENQSIHQVTFRKETKLKNASGQVFNLNIVRKVTLLPADTLAGLFGIPFPVSLDVVAYQTDNSLTNSGENAWTRETGLLSIWLLSMFNPSPGTTVFIPYRNEGDGVVVNDEYFGKVPPDRLIVENGTLFFKIDGKYRSKIGLPPERATALCGSYDRKNQTLTLLWCSLPAGDMPYVNSKWGDQDNPYAGDVINSYNDGPLADGSIMGPFYEIETSSPGAELKPGESITHSQRIIHIKGEEQDLEKMVTGLFDLRLSEISGKFEN